MRDKIAANTQAYVIQLRLSGPFIFAARKTP